MGEREDTFETANPLGTTVSTETTTSSRQASWLVHRRRALVALPLVVLVAAYTLFLGQALYELGSLFALIRRVYNFTTLAFPIGLALYASAILLYNSPRRGKPDGLSRASFRWASAGLIFSALLVLVRLYATRIEPSRLQVREVAIESPKLVVPHPATPLVVPPPASAPSTAAARPLRILHITDIQCDAVGDYDEKAFARMKALNPDLILFTGDLLQPLPPATPESELPKIAALLETLHPPLGLFGVLGDVDWRLADLARDGIGGMRLLNNEDAVVDLAMNTDADAGGDPNSDGTDLPRRRLRVHGLGLDESSGETGGGYDRVRRWLDSAAPGDFTILLGHRPDYILGVRDLAIDLCLAGHTHGGQIRVPGFGPILTLSGVPRELARGFHEVGATRLNTSAGIGCEHAAGLPDIRFFCPPEMTLIEIRPAR